MTDVLLVLPLLASPDFSASGADTLLNPIGEQNWQYGGEVWVGNGFARARATEFRGFAAVGASTMAYTVGDHRFDGTGWTLALEGGPSWSYGGDIRGFTELGVGLHARIAFPDWSDGAWVMGLGSHIATGVDFGRGDVRPRLGLLTSFTLAPSTYTGVVQLPEGTLKWSWSPSRIEMAVTVGVSFGKMAEGGASPAAPVAPAPAPAPASAPAPPPATPPA